MATKTKAKRAVAYSRISRDPTGTSVSPARQAHECEALIDSRGWEHVRTFTDRDLSAFKDSVRRPAFEEMLDGARRGDFDVLVATSISRLARSTVRFHALLAEMHELGVEIVCVHDPVDTSSASGRLITSVISALAQMESELVSERLRASHQVKAERGDWVQGPRTFGYTAQGEVIPEEADLLREAARQVVEDDKSVRSVTRWLNEQGSKTTRGNEWLSQTLNYTLSNPRIAGMRRGVDGEMMQGTWEPLIDHATFGRLSQSISERHKPRVPQTTSLLSGLVTCALCGATMHAASVNGSKGKMRIYACRKHPRTDACGGVAVLRDRLEETVIEELFGMSSTIEAASPRSKTAALEVELESLEERLAELAQMRFAGGQITTAEWKVARESLVSRVVEIEAELDVARSADVGDIRTWWETAGVDERRSMLRHLVSRVKVRKAKRGNTFDRSRVSVEWRFGPLLRAAAITHDGASPTDLAAWREDYERTNREAR
jgi:DNA invertase Pin-like site-specific DNA recombinase